MNNITICRLSEENFNESSFDEFIRHQESSECWRWIDGSYRLVPENYVIEWSPEQRRNYAKTIVDGIRSDCFGFAAFIDGKVAGHIFLSGQKFGSRNQYILLKMFHISAPYRQLGIGRKLFSLACAEARRIGAEKLYISANHTRESQEAYHRLGCTYTEEIDAELAAAEPQDIQMEYIL